MAADHQNAVVAIESLNFKHFETFSKVLGAGTAASIAEIVTIPIDTAKVRLQVQGESAAQLQSPKYRGMFQTLSTIAKQEGPSALYKGLTAGIQRQMCFCGIRIGLYDNARRFFGDTGEGKPQLRVKVLASCTTATTAVLLFQPTEVVKIRFQVAGAKQRYSGALDAYATIARTEGIKGLWRGCSTNVMRLSIVNCTEIVAYDYIKSYVLYKQLMQDSTSLHFMSAAIAGFLTTLIASPVDVVKTRFTNSPAGSYKTPIHCAISMARENGFTSFYKGFIPSFTRLCSWTIVMFLSYERIKKYTSTKQ